MRALSVSKLPDGVIAFCASNVRYTWSKLMPSVASFAFETSM